MGKPKRCGIEFYRFLDLNSKRLNVELQVHTDRTDGKGTIDQLLCAAQARGLAAIAFTEHVRRATEWFPGFAVDVYAAAANFPDLHVLVGCEAKSLDSAGALDASQDVLARCDIVLGSVHRLPDGKGGYLPFESLRADQLAEMECEFALALIRTAPIHVLAHPGGMYQRRFGRFPDELFRNIMQTALEHEVAVEINSSYLTDLPRFLDLCEEVNPYVSVGSDVHLVEEVGRCRDLLRAVGRWSE